MSKIWLVSTVSTLLLAGLCGASLIQDGGPPAVKPGAEHKVLEASVGEWDVGMKMFGEPGTPPQESKASATITLQHGGLWTQEQYKGEFMGQPFTGTGLNGFDSSKKKYITVWVDSMTESPLIIEGDFNAATKTFVYTYQAPSATGEAGKNVTHKHTSVHKSRDLIVFTMAEVGSDGIEVAGMEMTYTRKK